MPATTFDTLGYFEKLKAAGIPEAHAKAQVEALRELIEDQLATRLDIKGLKTEIREFE
jgi:hypothetical protein